MQSAQPISCKISRPKSAYISDFYSVHRLSVNENLNLYYYVRKTQAIWVLMQHSTVSTGKAAIPASSLATHKHIALSTIEISIYVRIASIYAGMDY